MPSFPCARATQARARGHQRAVTPLTPNRGEVRPVRGKAVGIASRQERKLAGSGARFIAIGAPLVVIGVVMALLPSLGELAANVRDYGEQATETPQPLRNPAGQIVYPGFPADVLWDFRFYSIAAQAVMWAAIGLLFAPLAERLLAPKAERVAAS